MSTAPETQATMGEFISVYKEIVGACSLVYQKLVTFETSPEHALLQWTLETQRQTLHYQSP